MASSHSQAWHDHPAAPGLALLSAAILGLIVANSPLAGTYADVLAFNLGLSVKLWIDDALMAVFFLFVGLELKRELVSGQLADPRRAALPAIAAIGGMAVPAILYATVNWGDPITMNGWAIPAATDIAFAICVLSLLGPSVPMSLRVFLVTVAVVDDLGAILVIALFYSSGLNFAALGAAVVAIAILLTLNRKGVRSLVPYLIVGAGLWTAVLMSGIHATLAGVLLAMTLPLNVLPGEKESPLEKLEHAINKPVSYFVLPVFGFANAGVSFAGLSLASLAEPIPMGIILGLVVGKPIGITAAVWLARAIRLSDLPDGLGWKHVIGAGSIAGIGFTMSLFIGGLAFKDQTDPAFMNLVRLGVMAASVIAAAIGAGIVRMAMAGSPARATAAGPQPAE